MPNKLFLIFVCVLFAYCQCLNKAQDCKCKIYSTKEEQTDFLELIVGGRFANPFTYPWMVSINLKDDRLPSFIRRLLPTQSKLQYHSCGGTIISENYVLTAAHCVPENTNYLSVGYGSNDLVEMFDNGRIKVKKFYIHPSWDNLTVENDIAILELETPILFTDYILPACLKRSDFDYSYDRLLSTAGFGLTTQLIVDPLTGKSKPASVSRYLKELNLRDESDKTFRCKLNNNFICANGINDGESSCSGDSGSALMKNFDQKTYVIGITSSTDQFQFSKDGRFLLFCNGITYYTKVAQYIDFIESVVGKDYCN